MRAKSCAAGLAALLVLGLASDGRACDSCGCALSPVDERGLVTGWRFGVAKQLTMFDRLQDSGHRISNDADQEIQSFLTRFSLGYQFDERDGIEVSIPYLTRRFRRLLDGTFQEGNVNGFGDAIVEGNRVVTLKRGADSLVIGKVRAGVKLPTGDSSFLREQANALLGGPDSVVGGHDLTLGSGSTDAVLGGSLYARRHHAMVTATVQEELRSTGSFDYRYADEFQWEVSPGWYLDYRGDRSLAVQVSLQGTSKGLDTFQGVVPVTDTGINEVYLGPRVLINEGKLAGLVDVNFPVHESNTDVQLVPSYRAHASLLYRF